MLTNIQKELKRLELTSQDEILLAVSGGVDSMVLWHLMHVTLKSYGVIHVNFGLRGKESDADEAMVSTTAKERGVPFYSLKADTRSYAQNEGVSIQMAAREIRYRYFQEIMDEKGYTVIATAHHLQDNIETFFINLNRGTGIKGLSGIKSDKSKFRPLLNETKEEIRAYAKQHEVKFREDASNEEIKYERNWFRHQLLKPWQERNSNFYSQMKANLERFQEANELLEELITEKTSIVRQELKQGAVSLELLDQLPSKKIMFRALFSSYGFNTSQLEDLINGVREKNTGSQFFSPTHTISINRGQLLLDHKEALNSLEQKCWKIEGDTQLTFPIILAAKKVERSRFNFSNSKLREGFDLDRLAFPLQLRKWKEGDKMRPLGMKGMKKVSDILIDEKIALPKKKNVFVVTSNEQIVWLVGIKLDDRFKVRKETIKVLEMLTE